MCASKLRLQIARVPNPPALMRMFLHDTLILECTSRASDMRLLQFSSLLHKSKDNSMLHANASA
eukprot:scaffold37553_cov13-Tisochrysis_lutea.AAC.1